jgi:cysteinyl-tRNA synthetase
MKRFWSGLAAATWLMAVIGPGAGCGSGGSGGSGATAGAGGTGGSGGGGQGGTATGGNGGTGGTGGNGGNGGNGGSGGAPATGRGFPVGAPWVSFYGAADGLDLDKLATTFRVINIDVDPDTGNFTDAQIQTLRAGGKNRVISYLDVGSCEDYRSYWSVDPPGHKSCQSTGALTTLYGGYPHERWANLGNADYRDLIVNYVAQRLADRGVDGFFLDNLEVVEHGAGAGEGPCDAACSQGGLDLVWELRQRFPDKLIVMQNASSDLTRLGTTHGVAYPSLLDGVSHEEVYSNGGDAQSRAEMKAWVGMKLTVNGSPFWLACEEYVGACSAAAKPEADGLYAQAAADELNAYVTDDSGMQITPCYWSDF